MITIILLVSRDDFLDKVITSIELLECNRDETNLLCIVDGEDSLFVKARNMVNDTKFKERLTVRLDIDERPSNYNIPKRRIHITAAHNQARELVNDKQQYVLLVEDDTTFGIYTLKRLLSVANRHSAAGLVQGAELGRWGVPYVGAWLADDIYDTTVLSSVDNIYEINTEAEPTKIDAGGMYCTLVRADLYKQHEFHCNNGLGPDVNLGLSLRRLGYQNFLVWQVPCTHYYKELGKELNIHPRDKSRNVVLTKVNDTKWRESYK
jgi:hypothetical protein